MPEREPVVSAPDEFTGLAITQAGVDEMKRRVAEEERARLNTPSRLAVVRTTATARAYYRHLRRVAGFGRDTANVMVAGWCLGTPGNARVGVTGSHRTIAELLAMSAEEVPDGHR